jgi:hypothetical protein
MQRSYIKINPSGESPETPIPAVVVAMAFTVARDTLVMRHVIIKAQHCTTNTAVKRIPAKGSVADLVAGAAGRLAK